MLAGRLAALLVAPAVFVAAMPAVASADTPGCVTRSEFRAAKKGMTMAKVRRIFDTRGIQQVSSSSGGYALEIRSYNACSRFSIVTIGFERNGISQPFKLSNKTAVWSS